MKKDDFMTGVNRLKAQFYKAEPKPETLALYWEKLQHWDAKRLTTAVNTIIDRSDGRNVFEWPTIGEIYAAAPLAKASPPTPKPKRTAGELQEFDAMLQDFMRRANGR